MVPDLFGTRTVAGGGAGNHHIGMGHWGGGGADGHQAAACQIRRQSLGQKRHALHRTRSRGRIPQSANRKTLAGIGAARAAESLVPAAPGLRIGTGRPPPGMDQTPVAGTKRAPPRRPAASKGAATGTIRS